MTWGVDEEQAGDLEGLPFHHVPAGLEDGGEGDFCRANVLRDPTGLAGGDRGPPYPVEDRCLAVVHVPEDGHNGLANRGHSCGTNRSSLLETFRLTPEAAIRRCACTRGVRRT